MDFNGRPGDPQSFDLLDDLLKPGLRLSYWRVAADEINYRRFFDVNELAALSMEREEVFTATHELILRLLREGKVAASASTIPTAVRSRAILRRLQQHFVLERARFVFEDGPALRAGNGRNWKAPCANASPGPTRQTSAAPAAVRRGGEDPRRRGETARGWPTHGTSGYEFLNLVNGLFVDADAARDLQPDLPRLGQDDTPFAELVYQKKFLILQVALSSELHMLAHQLDRLAQKNRCSRDFTLTACARPCGADIASFPVYRSYVADAGVPPRTTSTCRRPYTGLGPQPELEPPGLRFRARPAAAAAARNRHARGTGPSGAVSWASSSR